MDKRYFLIIIIICFCCANLYMIASFSDVIGDASVDIGNYTFSLPKGFSLYDDNGNNVYTSNSNTHVDLWVFYKIGDKDTFSSKYEEINKSNDYKILSNGTINVNDIKVSSIFYQRINDTSNRSTFYFTKDNHNFRILIMGYDYNTEKNKTIDMVSKIIESIRDNNKVQRPNV